MAKRVILAVAGAGKTYHICHTIDPNKRNLILAFTHENIYNIQKELCDAHGHMPEQTTTIAAHKAALARHRARPLGAGGACRQAGSQKKSGPLFSP